MYFYLLLGEFEKDCATFQASSDVWHNRHRVWVIIQQVKKKNSIYHFLGLSGNLYIIIELNCSSWMLREDSNGNGNEGGGGGGGEGG